MKTNFLAKWMCHSQAKAVMVCGLGEEKDFFNNLISEWTEKVHTMPKTYDQDGKGLEAVAHLHYFKNGCDWWITEKDVDEDGEGQIQAFGYTNLGDPQNAELGYINIEELKRFGVEFDLYWTPKTLREIKREVEGEDDERLTLDLD